MGAPPQDDAERGACLSKALKAIRRRRGLRACDAAAAMQMPLRSYEHFEAGLGRLNVDRVHRFAEALDADPYAILAAVEIGSPELAVRCADNKLISVLMMALQDFDAAAGEAIPTLDAAAAIAVFTDAFDRLATEARRRAQALQTWRNSRPGPTGGA